MDPPKECECLYDVLDMHKRAAEKELVRMAKREALKHTEEQRGMLKEKFGVGLLAPVWLRMEIDPFCYFSISLIFLSKSLLRNILQSNFNGSNTFWTMKIS